MDDLEMKIYQLMCASCPSARLCHEECTTCDEYEEELENALQTGEINNG